MSVSDRPHLYPDEFDALSHAASRVGERVRLELIDGKVRSTAGPDGNHGMIIEWLTRIFLRERPELFLHPVQGLKVQTNGRARPDASLGPSEAFAGQSEWAGPEPVLMAVEVTSYDSDTDARRRTDKPSVYAQTGIPVYLLIDRGSREARVHSEPGGGRYEFVRTVPFGKSLALPGPVDVTLDTGQLTDWAD